MINDFRNSKNYAVYEKNCGNCMQGYEILITTRNQLYKYLNSNETTCNVW